MLLFLKLGTFRACKAAEDIPLSFSNRYIRSVYVASTGFSGVLDTGAETVNIADDNAADKADDMPTLLPNLEVELEEEEEPLEGSEEAEPQLDEL